MMAASISVVLNKAKTITGNDALNDQNNPTSQVIIIMPIYS